MQGNTLSYLYSVEWPAFAAVAGIGWWQMVHDTPEDIAERRAFHERMRAASAEVVARTLPRSARAITVGSSELDSRVLGPGQAAQLGPGSSTHEAAALVKAGPGAGGAGGTLAPTGAGGTLAPTGADDAALAAALLASDEDDEPADEMAAYNRYLALLALKGKPKTWRNPHGL
jgi:hypothetical protein